ncbi:MAG: sigma-70 family RNA polymerase sigma factor [Oscillospiraceae bacterium]|jgi:RNA polymerase sigma-70 factor (ECF subfamily)|nr:sigma-70 family RNA polymerase sigma factor [Oscillospiraceae bacterium]MBQ5467819.1 sigma-70 family RNA polymerase sigma factor [Oscillospiraceae bacterium]
MTDNQLLRRLRAHDQDALVQLNDRYYDYLCAVIMQILGRAGAYADAEEICNDTIHAVWNNANSIKDEKLKPYLVTAARNRAKSWLRHRGTLEMDLDEIELPDSGTTLEDTAIREELAAAVRRAVDSMPRREREVFLRYYFYCQPGDEIARQLDIPASTVRSILSRGREKLRGKLMKEVSL